MADTMIKSGADKIKEEEEEDENDPLHTNI